MFPDAVFDERKDLADRIANAPDTFVHDNAAALLRIIWELQASLGLELQVIQGIKTLNLSDASAMSEYLDKFSDYVDRRDFNLERTSCGRIANIYWGQIRARESAPGVQADEVTALDEILETFTSADVQFAEEIEPFMNRALATLQSIKDAADSGRPDDAQAQRDRFTEEYREEVQRLKRTLRELSDVGQSLLDKL